MIICFNNKIKSFDKKNLNFNYIQGLMPDLSHIKDKKCPCCKQKNALIRYGHYSRHILIVDSDNNLHDFYVSVQRVFCNSCNKTHALLPSFTVPYVCMSIFSIGQIVSSAAKSSSYKAEQLFSLSYQTILRYIAMVAAFFMDFKILNNNKNYINSQQFNKNYYLTNCKTYTIQNYVYDFFKFHNWPLFMQKYRNNSSCKIKIYVSKSPPT